MMLFHEVLSDGVADGDDAMTDAPIDAQQMGAQKVVNCQDEGPFQLTGDPRRTAQRRHRLGMYELRGIGQQLPQQNLQNDPTDDRLQEMGVFSDVKSLSGRGRNDPRLRTNDLRPESVFGQILGHPQGVSALAAHGELTREQEHQRKIRRLSHQVRI